MEWLLILSALLNAATGAFTGTRPAETAASPHEVAVESVAAAESLASAVVALSAPAPAGEPQESVDSPEPAAVESPVRPVPSDTDRLIE